MLDFEGIDDYQHSWIIDLIFKYLIGIDFNNKLVIDPFPFVVDKYSVNNLYIRGHELSINYDKENYYLIKLDGKDFHCSKSREKIEIEL